SHHPARVLDPYQRPRGKGRHRPRHHPFHGRGGVLRPYLAHLSRPLDRSRLAGRAQGQCGEPRKPRSHDGGRLHRTRQELRPGGGCMSTEALVGTKETAPPTGRARRFTALVRKESLRVIRDPSSILIAFVLPLILLVIFGYGVSLEATHTRIGL